MFVFRFGDGDGDFGVEVGLSFLIIHVHPDEEPDKGDSNKRNYDNHNGLDKTGVIFDWNFGRRDLLGNHLTRNCRCTCSRWHGLA